MLCSKCHSQDVDLNGVCKNSECKQWHCPNGHPSINSGSELCKFSACKHFHKSGKMKPEEVRLPEFLSGLS